MKNKRIKTVWGISSSIWRNFEFSHSLDPFRTFATMQSGRQGTPKRSFVAAQNGGFRSLSDPRDFATSDTLTPAEVLSNL
jgi:hypothetical protein